jgi:6-pyruvoyl-tetrahydropterin synthase
MLTTLAMTRAEFGFYAAHIALYNGEVEPLHGHTFQVTLRVSGVSTGLSINSSPPGVAVASVE